MLTVECALIFKMSRIIEIHHLAVKHITTWYCKEFIYSHIYILHTSKILQILQYFGKIFEEAKLSARVRTYLYTNTLLRAKIRIRVEQIIKYAGRINLSRHTSLYILVTIIFYA